METQKEAESRTELMEARLMRQHACRGAHGETERNKQTQANSEAELFDAKTEAPKRRTGARNSWAETLTQRREVRKGADVSDSLAGTAYEPNLKQ